MGREMENEEPTGIGWKYDYAGSHRKSPSLTESGNGRKIEGI